MCLSLCSIHFFLSTTLAPFHDEEELNLTKKKEKEIALRDLLTTSENRFDYAAA